jgi:hypothetical protein
MRYNIRLAENLFYFGIYQRSKFILLNRAPIPGEAPFIQQVNFSKIQRIFLLPFLKQMLRYIFGARCLLMPAHSKGHTLYQTGRGFRACSCSQLVYGMVNFQYVIAINTAAFNTIAYGFINKAAQRYCSLTGVDRP